MPVVVSDTSPIRALAHLGQLDLLSRLFDSVVIPPAVREELLQSRRRFRAVQIQEIPGATVRAPAHLQRVQQLSLELQRGEAEAIALAEEMGVVLLIDEMAGRSVATRMGLRITGVVGVLIEAKYNGLIPRVMPLLDQLRHELGFFLSDKLLSDTRRNTDE